MAGSTFSMVVDPVETDANVGMSTDDSQLRQRQFGPQHVEENRSLMYVLCRILTKMRFYTRSCEDEETPEVQGRCASWLATLGFFLYIFSAKLSKPLLLPPGPHSFCLLIVGMSGFILLISAALYMLVVGAGFTHMQKIFMLIALIAVFLT